MPPSIVPALSFVSRSSVPSLLWRHYKIAKARKALNRARKVECKAGSLRPAGRIDLDRIWHDREAAAAWASIARHLAGLLGMAPDGARTAGSRGVNPGDRRAIFYLVHAMQPGRVLEIGTNVGFSTLHIAAALRPGGSMVTVDIVDVNDPAAQPWRDSGVAYAPRDLLAAAGLGETVRFVTGRSLDYMRSCEGAFDFIFLDGSHEAPVVYREVPLALRILAAGGVILLHDYYPENRWLWRNRKVIPGPCLAIERLRAEGAPIVALPCGALPWPTKFGSTATSLAVLARAEPDPLSR